MDLKSSVDELNAMILRGEVLPAFDRFYAPNVVMNEVGEEPRVGKAVNREFEEKWVEGVRAFHSAEAKNVAVNESSPGTGVAFVEWFMHYDHDFADGEVKVEQVTAQEWENGQIVRETFYHG